MEFNATFIVAFFSFIVFTVLMNLILYKSISDIVMKRKDFVDSNYAEANRNSEKKVEILLDKREKLAQAGEDAKVIVAQKTAEANAQKDEIALNAKKEAQKNIDAYNLYYKNATKEAKEFLNAEIVNLAQAISDKFLDPEEKISQELTEELTESVTQG